MNDPAKLVATFVNVGSLFTLLSTRDHQVIYGRRGTGKTHALTYLSEIKQAEGHAAITIDLRNVGSNGGLYNDNAIPLSQRATAMLVDTLTAIHEGLLEYFLLHEEVVDLSQAGPLLDRMAEAITETRVVGPVEREGKTGDNYDKSRTSTTSVSIATKSSALTIGDSTGITEKSAVEYREKETGSAQQRLHFGSLGQVFRQIARVLSGNRVWILLDEWSHVPLDIQPYLADLLRHSIFPVSCFTVKIAAIEQRSNFRILAAQGDYIGAELGADIAADLNLDDYMVFENDSERAKAFFKELLFKNFKETEELDISAGPTTPDDLIHQAFTQINAYDEFVRASEGVPRDAINIITLAAQKAARSAISTEHVRTAARNWYQRDKERATRGNSEANALLHWIIDTVIQKRQARAFLLRNDNIYPMIDTLFDARVLHVLKRNVSSNEHPGIRYDVYKLDYGCYIELIYTQKYPRNLLPQEIREGEVSFRATDEDVSIEVPVDDYRAIRRAVLDINEFHHRPLTLDLYG